jgi:hypothetical protein
LTPMALIGWVLLLFLAVLPALATSSAHRDGNLTLRCHPDQAASLFELKKIFLILPLPQRPCVMAGWHRLLSLGRHQL